LKKGLRNGGGYGKGELTPVWLEKRLKGVKRRSYLTKQGPSEGRGQNVNPLRQRSVSFRGEGGKWKRERKAGLQSRSPQRKNAL